MTQEQINKIFQTPLGEECILLYTTSDDAVFIRRQDAIFHTNEMMNANPESFVDTTITEWLECDPMDDIEANSQA